MVAAVKERAANKRAKKEKVQETKDEAAGLLIECGCCFGDFCFVSMGAPSSLRCLLSLNLLAQSNAPTRTSSARNVPKGTLTLRSDSANTYAFLSLLRSR